MVYSTLIRKNIRLRRLMRRTSALQKCFIFLTYRRNQSTCTNPCNGATFVKFFTVIYVPSRLVRLLRRKIVVLLLHDATIREMRKRTKRWQTLESSSMVKAAESLKRSLWSTCFSRLYKKSSLHSPTACPWNELSRIKKLANSSKPIDDYTRVHYRLSQINYERLVVALRTGSSSLSLALPLSSHRLSR